MRIVSLKDADAFLNTAKVIYDVDGRMLLQTGHELKEQYLEKLREKGFQFLYVQDENDNRADDVIREDLRRATIKFMKDFIAKPEVVSDSTIIREISQTIRKRERRKKSRPVTNLDIVRYLVNEIIEEILVNKEGVINIEDTKTNENYFYAHCVNVCVLSLLMAKSLAFNRYKMVNLGVGALLHDVYLPRMLPEILVNPFESGFPAMGFEEHTVKGYEYLRQQKGLSSVSTHVAFEHHEHFNGTGYPRRLAGEKILLAARITAVAEAYDELTSERNQRPALAPFKAMAQITRLAGSHFDPTVVAAFAKHVALYPVGWFVRLSNKAAAVVLKNNRFNLQRPLVQIVIRNNDGKLVYLEKVDLMEHEGIAITGVIYGSEGYWKEE